MFIKCKFPVRINIINKKKSFNTEVKFIHKKYEINMWFEGEKITKNERGPENKTLYIKKCNSLNFIVKDDNLNTINNFIQSKNTKKIIELLISTGDRCIRVIRNYGSVYNLHELHLDLEGNFKYILAGFEIKKRNNRNKWKPLYKINRQEEFINAMVFIKTEPDYYSSLSFSELDMSLWEEIKEVIKENLPIPPEKEFTVNALEHTKKNNLRSAIVESIIGLEIILTKYLKNYLIRQNIPKIRIDEKFLTPDLGLTARVSVMLDLSIKKQFNNIFMYSKPEEQFEDFVSIDDILNVVKWRNNIIHRTGNIPKNVSRINIKDGINKVLVLVKLLAVFNMHLEILNLIKDVVEKYKIDEPILTKRGIHDVYISIKTMGDKEKICKINHDLFLALENYKKIDSKFLIYKHLRMIYTDSQRQPVAKFINGNLLFEQ